MEEVEIRLSDIKKLSYEFKRDIVQSSINPRTGKVMAEKVIRYYEDKVKDKVNSLECLIKCSRS
jgi:predicted metal-binding protein